MYCVGKTNLFFVGPNDFVVLFCGERAAEVNKADKDKNEDDANSLEDGSELQILEKVLEKLRT